MDFGDDKDREVAAQLFGRCGKVKATGGHVLRADELAEPFEPGAVVHVFCTGCGFYHQLGEKRARDLARWGGIEESDSFEKVFFQVGRCVLCLDEYEDIKLLELPEFLPHDESQTENGIDKLEK